MNGLWAAKQETGKQAGGRQEVELALGPIEV
jgi:hypothetical protein